MVEMQDMSSKKLLAILSRYLWPIDSGRKESLNHYFKELHDSYGYEIRIMCFMESSQHYDPNDLPEYIKEITVLKDTGFAQKLGNIFVHSFLGNKWPLQCSLYYCKKNFQIIKERVERWKPDVIFTEMIRTCVYYKAFANCGAVTIANLDDLLSKRYLRQAKFNNSKASIAGTYSEKLPGIISKATQNKWVRRSVLRLEAKRCEKWECKYYELFDYVLMTSDIERDELNLKMHSNKALTLSVGVDCEYYRQECNAKKDMMGISFLGNFAAAANTDSLELIEREVLSKLTLDYHFYVIGNCPDQVKSKFANNDRIIFCGRVDDIREYIKSTIVFLAPIAYGTGIKTKIVEAMAMGMPVVTNSVGVEGLNVQNGLELFISDDPQELAEITMRLLNDPELRRKIGLRGQSYALEYHDWEKIFKAFCEMSL